MSQRIDEDAIAGPDWERIDFGNGRGMVQWRGGNGGQGLPLPLTEWLRRQRLRAVADCRTPSGRAGIVFVAKDGEAQEATEYR